MSDDLARRAVACRHWRWAPGMLVDSDDYGSWRLYESGPHLSACGVRGGFVAAWDAIADAERMDAYPALDDPATVGALLALVREAWEPHRGSDCIASTMHTGSGWGVGARYGSEGLAAIVLPTYETEAAALVAALEAAP
jgi:hypothetical protein